jgi:hypothetical protein
VAGFSSTENHTPLTGNFKPAIFCDGEELARIENGEAPEDQGSGEMIE